MKLNRARLGLIGMAAALAMSVSACSTISGVQSDIDKAQKATDSCAGAVSAGKDFVNLLLAGLESGAIVFENSGELIDAVTAMDNEKVQKMGKEATAGLPEVDAKKARENLDKYGAAVKECRLGLKDSSEG